MTQSDAPRSTTIRGLISEAGTAVNEQIGEVRIVGTVSGHRPGRYTTFGQLVAHDPSTNGVEAKLPVVFRSGTVSPGRSLNGSLIAATGQLTSHLTYGPLQFTAAAVELLDEQSQATRSLVSLRRTLQDTGRDRINKSIPLSPTASRLVVLTPIGGGAGGADFRNRLDERGHDWQLTMVGVAMGGDKAAPSIANAIGEHSDSPCDAIVICRGGGAPSDLVAFDSLEVASAIIECSVPVVVAVGHATDNHLADLVAHTSLPTPSAAADWFNRRRSESAAQARELVVRANQASAIQREANAAATSRDAERLVLIAEQRLHSVRSTIAVAALAASLVVIVLVMWLLT